MTLIKDDLPRSLIAGFRDFWCRRKARREEKHALYIIANKPHTHLLEDAGLSRDDAAHLSERQRLHRIAEWNRWGWRDL